MKYNELTEDLTNFKGYRIVSILYMSEIRKFQIKVTLMKNVIIKTKYIKQNE